MEIHSYVNVGKGLEKILEQKGLEGKQELMIRNHDEKIH